VDIVCVGDCGIDRYLASNETVVGGITANFARNAHREFSADSNIHIVSCVGDDEYGDLVRSTLANSGIDCRISTLPGSTPMQDILIESGGERNFVRYDEGVLSDFDFSEDERQLVETSDLLVAPVYRQILSLFGKLMSMETRGIVCIDFADFLEHPDFELLERHIANIDIGFFGLTSDQVPIVDRLAQLARQFDKLFVITLAARGSLAFHGTQEFDCPAQPVDQVIDTTGAGDAYAAGFLSAHCQGASVQESMYRGASIAAKTVGRAGAFADL